MASLDALERELAYIRAELRKYEQKRTRSAPAFRVALREKEMELLEHIGKMIDGPP